MILDHWYKEKRGKETNKKIYQFLRKKKIKPGLCRYMRYWSIGHINTYLKTQGHNCEIPKKIIR